MMNAAFSTGIPVPFESSYTLARNVSAIQVISEAEGPSRLGLITQLPAGAEVRIGGIGFDDKTIKIRCGGASYYVFVEDLEPQRKRAASAVAG